MVASYIPVKVYGMPTCPYCDYVHEQIVGREDEFEYINIGENIRNTGRSLMVFSADGTDCFQKSIHL